MQSPDLGGGARLVDLCLGFVARGARARSWRSSDLLLQWAQLRAESFKSQPTAGPPHPPASRLKGEPIPGSGQSRTSHKASSEQIIMHQSIQRIALTRPPVQPHRALKPYFRPLICMLKVFAERLHCQDSCIGTWPWGGQSAAHLDMAVGTGVGTVRARSG